MFGLFSRFRRSRLRGSYRRDTIEVHGNTYSIRELSIAEATGFVELRSDEENSPELVCAWLICKACEEFSKLPPEVVAMELSVSTLVALSDGILELSGMTEKSGEEIEKKSESDQS